MEIIRGASADAANTLQVTELKTAVKDQNRVNVFINTKYSFSLDLAQVVDYGLKVGQSITPDQLAKLKRASAFGKLYQRALEYTLTRPHSEQEVCDYLKRKQAKQRSDAKHYEDWQRKLQQDPALKEQLRANRQNGKKTYHPHKPGAEITDQDIARVIERLKDRGYIDDANFARYFCENRFVKKGISLRRLRQDLAKKGIAPSLINEALSERPSRDDATEIQKIVIKKRRLKTYDLTDADAATTQAKNAKLIQYLTRQGFDYELAKNSVHETDSQN